MINQMVRMFVAVFVLGSFMSGLSGCPPKKEEEHKPGDGHDHGKEGEKK